MLYSYEKYGVFQTPKPDRSKLKTPLLTEQRAAYDQSLNLGVEDQNPEVRRVYYRWHRSKNYQRPVFDDDEAESDELDDYFDALNGQKKPKQKPLKFVQKKSKWF